MLGFRVPGLSFSDPGLSSKGLDLCFKEADLNFTEPRWFLKLVRSFYIWREPCVAHEYMTHYEPRGGSPVLIIHLWNNTYLIAI